ncbi:molybdopterin oxidoreductase family protein [Halococcus thailandensis]|uniref:Formate dehydrogenase subunit alpha n=1 Tax=Halococcus thailandensis JCM 13552 TaxID=1227457 RepID=M0MYK4_9EURY|nr:molybdopterin-dependent oxidoreductase [Halococcus thailandensis]EMA49480.1 formate dehydrogenase subunit alpha [Halococcus thailandensis JCM 13552]
MSEPREETKSICPLCAVGCSVRYDGATGRARGWPGAPVNEGGELCPKGIAAFDVFDDEDRLTRPLMRRNGDLEPVSWNEAYDRIEREFEKIVTDHGPDALAFLGAPHCTNEENYLFGKLARSLGTNNVDNRARLCHDSTVSAMEERLGSGGMTNSLADLADAEAFIVIGSNPADQQPVAFDSYIRPAVNDGAQLIHIDPRANATTRLADTHIAPRPGTDALVVALFVKTILDEGLVDEEFVADRTEGFAAFAASVDEMDDETVAERAGVDPAAIREAARAFGGAERAAVVAGTGVEGDGPDDSATADALLNLLLLTGNLGKRGAGMNLFRGLNNEQGACDAGALPHQLPGGRPVTDPTARAQVADVWGVEPPAEPSPTELDLVREFGAGIRAAFVLGENPAVTKLDRQGVARGLRSLDFLVVQDVTHTETTAHADVVLPAAIWSEKAGTVTNLDRQVQRTRVLESPPGAARSDLAILCALGKRLVGDGFEYDDPQAVFDELTAVNPQYAGMSYEGIGMESQRWPFPDGADTGTDVLHREEFMSGDRRAPFVTIPTVESDEEIADDELVLLTGSRSGDVATTTMGSGVGTPDDTLLVHPTDADARGVADGERVVVESRDGRIELVAERSRGVRQGTVFVHAGVADPLLGAGRTRVQIS